MDQPSQSSNLPRVAVVLPCYRVTKHILDVIRTIPPQVGGIFVVDDHCPEGSGNLVQTQAADPRVVVIRHEQNLGVGGAVLTGYAAADRAGFDVFVKMDGDGQMDPAYLNRLINPILSRSADYTKGNRFFDLEALQTMPSVRRFGNFALTLFTKAASGYWHISDPTNGYTAIHRQAYRLIATAPLAHGYFFETSMLINLNIVRAVAVDIPIPARYRNESSSLRVGRVLVSFPMRLIAGLLRRIIWRYYIYDVNAVSILLPFSIIFMGGGAAFGLDRWIMGAIAGIPQTPGTVAIALLPIIVGFMMFLQALLMDFTDSAKMPVCRLLDDTQPDTAS